MWIRRLVYIFILFFIVTGCTQEQIEKQRKEEFELLGAKIEKLGDEQMEEGRKNAESFEGTIYNALKIVSGEGRYIWIESKDENENDYYYVDEPLIQEVLSLQLKDGEKVRFTSSHIDVQHGDVIFSIEKIQ